MLDGTAGIWSGLFGVGINALGGLRLGKGKRQDPRWQVVTIGHGEQPTRGDGLALRSAGDADDCHFCVLGRWRTSSDAFCLLVNADREENPEEEEGRE